MSVVGPLPLLRANPPALLQATSRKDASAPCRSKARTCAEHPRHRAMAAMHEDHTKGRRDRAQSRSVTSAAAINAVRMFLFW